MCYKEFSITELEKQLDGIELVEAKIGFVSDEILKCEKVIQDLHANVESLDPKEIKFAIKQNGCHTSLLELLNKDSEIRKTVTKKILKTCKEKLCERNNHFLERAKSIKENLQTKFDLQVKSMNIHPSHIGPENKENCIEKIIWLCGKEKLLMMFTIFKENNILSEHTTEEILFHFTNDKQIPFITGNNVQIMFRWRISDSSFAVFVNELVNRKAVDVDGKFKIFLKHFLNKKGEPFRNLAQKKYYIENYSKTGNMIREILNSINLSLLLICCNLLSSFMLE